MKKIMGQFQDLEYIQIISRIHSKFFELKFKKKKFLSSNE